MIDFQELQRSGRTFNITGVRVTPGILFLLSLFLGGAVRLALALTLQDCIRSVPELFAEKESCQQFNDYCQT